jgi:hypothetical protein
MIERPHHGGYPGDLSVTPPEYFPVGYTLRQCNALLSPSEQNCIANAALLEHAGSPDRAEIHRRWAGYT